MDTEKKRNAKPDPSFESMLKELETIVKTMEDPKISIEKLVQLHEEGKALALKCQKKLESVELKIEKLKPGTKDQFEDFGKQ